MRKLFCSGTPCGVKLNPTETVIRDASTDSAPTFQQFWMAKRRPSRSEKDIGWPIGIASAPF